jgi:hypothetical protein
MGKKKHRTKKADLRFKRAVRKLIFDGDISQLAHENDLDQRKVRKLISGMGENTTISEMRKQVKNPSYRNTFAPRKSMSKIVDEITDKNGRLKPQYNHNPKSHLVGKPKNPRVVQGGGCSGK